MSIDIHPKRQGRTPEEIVAQQKADAARQRQQQAGRPSRRVSVPPAAGNTAAPANVPAKVTATVPATSAADTRTPQQRYLDEVAPTSIVGRLIKFSKDGAFTTSDDGAAIDDSTEFFALCGDVQIGWIKFSQEEGVPPERHMGLLYDGFQMPVRESLGDLNSAEWPEGLSGQPEDVWQHQQNLVLQQVATHELFTFSTTSKTGRRAVGNLLRHYDRLQRTSSGDVPIVRLRAGGFNHKDDRIGWVATPVFAVVGHAPRDDAAKPEIAPPDTSAGGDVSDEIPW
jgi:hypothetical protein